MSRSALCWCLAAIAVATALPAAAHEAPADPTPEAAAAAPAATFQGDVAADLQRTGGKILALAEAIPADKYGWRPADGVRSVSEVFVHLATTNLFLPVSLGAAPAPGVTMPKDLETGFAWMGEREATITVKDAVIAEVRAALDYATKAVAGLSDAALAEELNLFFPASKRAYVLILLTHNHEHLGQAIAYARSIGVTPPWSEAEAAAVEEAKKPDGY